MQHRRRTAAAGSGMAAIIALTLGACSGEEPAGDGGTGDADAGGSQEQVELRMAWWGAEARHQLTQEVIDLFEAEHPNITVTADYSDWGGYWDRLATATAAGDMPDVLQMDGAYLATYAEQNSLMDLYTLQTLETENIDEAALAAGEIDGSLYGLVNAVNSWAVVANRTLIEEAGMQMPDDTSWTWQELADLSAELTEATPDGVYGLADYALTQGTLDQWARQSGDDLWTPEGGFGVSQETMTEYFEYARSLMDSGATPPASAQIENVTATQDQSATATNTAALAFWWSNQLSALSTASGQELELLRPPVSEDGSRGIWYRPSQFWSVAATTEHPEEAGMLVDFLVNSEAAGEVLLAERGTPANVDVRQAIAPMLSEADQAIAGYLDEIADELDGVAALAPAGSSEFEATLRRYASEVYFGSMSPEEAAAGFIAEMDAMLAAG